MASRIRFPAANAVFEAFPDLRQRASPPETDCEPTEHARRLLASARPHETIAYLAYLLPRREAVWWARQCVAALLGPGAEDDALRAADNWVKGPDEDNRNLALQIGNAADPQAATTWVARAAAWSGGSMCGPDVKPMAVPPTLCAQAVNGAIMVAASAGEPSGVINRIRACAEAGIRFADGDQAQVVLPEGDNRPKARAIS